MILTGADARVLHLHPTRRCNLRCLHCYSTSSPKVSAELSAALLASTVSDAAAEGYNAVSISGGEPLAYRGLAQVLETARSAGMSVLIVSNGMLLDERRLGELRDRVDLLAISLDGAPTRHNQMRQSERAFEVMASRLPSLRATNIPFGFVFTLSNESIDDLIWAAEFALQEGARLLHIHPLAEVGRAATELKGRALCARDRNLAWLAALNLAREYAGRLQIHIDLVEARALSDAAFDLDDAVTPAPDDASLASLISPLIVEDDGTVVPLEYGMDRRHALGTVTTESLRELGRRWRSSPSGYAAFRERCERARASVLSDDRPRAIDWYQELMLVP